MKQKGLAPIVIVVLIAVALGGYFIYSQRTKPTPLPTTQPAYTPNPESFNSAASPTPTSAGETANWKTYTSQKIATLSFSAFSISYPTSWEEEITYIEPANINTGFTFSLIKNNHSILVYQAAFGGEACVFDEDPSFDGPQGNFRGKPYVEIQSLLGTLRRVQSTSDKSNILVFTVCNKRPQQNIFQKPLDVGSVRYEVPVAYNELLLKEMDTILATLKKGK